MLGCSFKKLRSKLRNPVLTNSIVIVSPNNSIHSLRYDSLSLSIYLFIHISIYLYMYVSVCIDHRLYIKVFTHIYIIS